MRSASFAVAELLIVFPKVSLSLADGLVTLVSTGFGVLSLILLAFFDFPLLGGVGAFRREGLVSGVDFSLDTALTGVFFALLFDILLCKRTINLQ